MLTPPASLSPAITGFSNSGLAPSASPADALATAVAGKATAGSGDRSVESDTTLAVLHLVNGQHFAGAERVQSHLGRCLPTYGVRADFACLKPGRFADAVDAAEGTWGRAFRYAMRNRFDVSIVPAVAQRVREGRYGLLHAHTPRSAMIASLVSRRTRVPWVYHVHSPAARDSSKPLSNWFNATMERWSLRNCSHLITVSNSLRRELIAAGEGLDRVTVIRNGVPGIRHVRQRYPQVGGRWLFGMVALMRPRKGLEIALDAVSILRKQGHDAMLRCIGPFESDEYRRSIDSRIDGLGIRPFVETLGFKNDVPHALAQLDAMLLPSLYGEGLPMVVLEAMASALPVIATRVEGTPEAIRDRIDGLLADPGSAESLATQMRDMMSGQVDWHSMGQSAFSRHAEHFSDFAMSEGIARVYREVIALPRRSSRSQITIS